MIKIPRLKYFCPSRVPIYDQNGKILENESYKYNLEDMSSLIKQVFDIKNSFICDKPPSRRGMATGPYTDIDIDMDLDDDDMMTIPNKKVMQVMQAKPNIYTNLSTLLIYRGFDDNMNNKEIMRNIQNDESVNRRFKNDIIGTVIKNKPLRYLNGSDLNSIACISNSTLMKVPFGRISSIFNRNYARSAFLHWYIAEGMARTEIQQSDVHIRDLLQDYRDLEE